MTEETTIAAPGLTWAAGDPQYADLEQFVRDHDGHEVTFSVGSMQATHLRPAEDGYQPMIMLCKACKKLIEEQDARLEALAKHEEPH